MELADLCRQLVSRSERDYYNPYTYFEWPDALPNDVFWMSEELLSLHGTEVYEELPRARRIALSRQELRNFFSVTIQGEQRIISDVALSLSRTNLRDVASYLLYFMREENSHLVFFTGFCERYAGGVLLQKKLGLDSTGDAEIDTFIAFAHTLIAELVADFVNGRLAADETLPTIIRQINRRHHLDETRHIALGRELLRWWWPQLRATLAPEDAEVIRRSITLYMESFTHDLCNPAAYRAAGLDDPYALRRLALSGARAGPRAELTRRARAFFETHGLLTSAQGDL